MPTRAEAIQNVARRLREMPDGQVVLRFYYKLPSRLWRHTNTGLSHTAETLAEKVVQDYSSNRKGDVYRSRYAEARIRELLREVDEKTVIIDLLQAMVAEPEPPAQTSWPTDGSVMTAARNPEGHEADGHHE